MLKALWTEDYSTGPGRHVGAPAWTYTCRCLPSQRAALHCSAPPVPALLPGTNTAVDLWVWTWTGSHPQLTPLH